MSTHDLESALREAGQQLHEPLLERYTVLKNRLSNVEYGYSAAGFPEGNDHGPGHIERVLEKLSALLGPNPLAELGPYELFLAMMSVLYHDVGLLKGRAGHAGASAVLVGDEQNDYVIHPLDRDVIRAAVASHSSDKRIDEETANFPDPLLIGDQLVRPRVIAALVRFADELDEDFRRADPKLQERLGIPDTSQFFWEFCQRITGIRPDHANLVVQVHVRLEPTDIGRTVRIGTTEQSFLAAFARKLAKINGERVGLNAHLPATLRYQRLVVALQPVSGTDGWRKPRAMTYEDSSSAADFLRAYPELFAGPASDQLAATLEFIRTGNLDGADRLLAQLGPFVPDLPRPLGMKVLYEVACSSSLRARKSKDPEDRARLLGASLEALEAWWALGVAGGFLEKGETARNEIFRLGSDADLRFLLKQKRVEVLALLPLDLRDALPEALPNRARTSGGGGVCIVSGTEILTPGGYVAVQSLRAGDRVISFPVPSFAAQETVIRRVSTSRQSWCLEIDGEARCTGTQPVLLADNTWASADRVV